MYSFSFKCDDSSGVSPTFAVFKTKAEAIKVFDRSIKKIRKNLIQDGYDSSTDPMIACDNAAHTLDREAYLEKWFYSEYNHTADSFYYHNGDDVYITINVRPVRMNTEYLI